MVLPLVLLPLVAPPVVVPVVTPEADPVEWLPVLDARVLVVAPTGVLAAAPEVPADVTGASPKGFELQPAATSAPTQIFDAIRMRTPFLRLSKARGLCVGRDRIAI